MAASPLMAEAKPPSAPRSSSSSPPPILAVAILGILTTAILLLSYYLFVTKCRTGRRLRSPLANQARGLHPSLIRSIPVVNFTVASNDIELRSQCAVCLNEFQNMERLKLLPGCSHTFHIDCIETWLQFNANCPLCRSDVTASAAAVPAQFILVVEQSRSSGPIDVSAEITGQTSTTLTRKF
ncbi:RING-H2 finger protein ATL1-like [Zingiber officinale]|uniref:RING-H2 finger protein ATL1-like n=1 Tax=Zingiber officinale TaxID=94328 RepID=UPI001C4CC778|nr:RING-H2 finger protein ATL1-like [Zingiber officinale]